MKFTIPRTDFTKALNLVRSVAGGGSLPILGNVAVSAGTSSLTLMCTDLDIYIRTDVAASVSQKGDCTVNAGLFFGIVNALTGDDVDVKHKNNTLTIKAGSSKYNLGTLDMSEFPPAPKLEKPVTFGIPQVKLRSVLASTAFCQSDDGARYVLCSTLLTVNGKLSAVATDGRRLCLDEAEIDKKQKETASLILPINTVKELLRLLPETENDKEPVGPCEVGMAANSVRFKFGDVILHSKLIEGIYPNFKQVIPLDDPNPVPIGRADLLSALKRIHLIGADGCTLEFEGQMLTVQAKGTKNSCPGEAWETLMIPRVDPMKVAFTPQYLIEALEAVSDDEVLLHLTDDKSPLVLKVAGKAWLCVIMPRRLEGAETKKEEEKPKDSEKAPAKVAPAKK